MNKRKSDIDDNIVIASSSVSKIKIHQSSLFLKNVINYIETNSLPFEYVDAWVPCIRPINGVKDISGTSPSFQLCCGGYDTASICQLRWKNSGSTSLLTPSQKQNFFDFGEYSLNFCFELHQGVPGSVFVTDEPSWDNVNEAKLHTVPRIEGCVRYGIKTIVGIPVICPKVGKIVVAFYSMNERKKDKALAFRLRNYLTNLLPIPKWHFSLHSNQLIINKPHPTVNEAYGPPQITIEKSQSSKHSDVLHSTNQDTQPTSTTRESSISGMISLLTDIIPTGNELSLSDFQINVISLRLLLLKSFSARSSNDTVLVETLTNSYLSYKNSGKNREDIAQFLAQDYFLLTDEENT